MSARRGPWPCRARGGSFRGAGGAGGACTLAPQERGPGRPVPPPRDVYPVPRQLDRSDFRRVETPWLVALFSSTACDSCDGLMAKLAVLESADVATCEIEYHAQPDLHDRYEIAGIPTTVGADGDG